MIFMEQIPKIKVINKFNKEVNILHFQGNNLEQFVKTSSLIFNFCQLDPLEKDLTIVACWTDVTKCILAQQFIKNNLTLYNALPNNYDYNQPWDMRNKIKYYIDYLENEVKTNIVMLLDGYDVLLSSTKDIVKKFTNQPYRILFNSTTNNFPDVDIDHIPNRLSYDRFAPFFNAGCCIGYKEDLIKFYKECYELINIDNPYNSEQYVVRYAFSKYSDDPNQKFIWIDFERNIFHSMGYMSCDFNSENNIIKITDNLYVAKNLRDSEHGDLK